MSEHRKIVIIKTHFQQKLIIKTVLTTFITLNIVITAAYLMTGSLFVSSLATQTFMQYMAGLELIAVGVIYFISRQISFHIAGPVYAIERSLKMMNEGDLSVTLKLRKGDHFEEVSDALNLMLTTYRDQFGVLKHLVSDIKTKTENNQTISGELDALDEKLNFFKLEKEELKD